VAILLIVVAAIAVLYLMRPRPAHQSLVSATIGQDPTKHPIAVMFFDNESRSLDLDWLREGLAHMIISDLSRSNNLVVLSRPQLHVLLERIAHKPSEKISLDEALNIGRLTQAKVLVLGSFAKLGEQIRIDAHLHDARTVNCLPPSAWWLINQGKS